KSSVTVTANDNVNVKVTFVQDTTGQTVDLVFAATNAEHGELKASINSEDKTTGSKITKGSTVTFTATPKQDWKVGTWEGTGDDAANKGKSSVTVTANDNVNVKVTFEQ
ncbi:MAG: InlB B-repeat-containing protein, partial [Treponema sp.]